MVARTSLKKNDQVYILSGKDRGKTGRVLIVMPGDGKIVVEGVQMIKRHTRANPQRNIKGGIVEKESPIQISNVALVCKNCGKHTRIKHLVLADGRHTRTCKKCGSAIE
jgi:large subunit ribosomal protein L24